jgi:hypothetical protein
MATTSRAPTRTSLQLPRPIEPTKPLASEPCGPQTANLPLLAPTLHLFARGLYSKQQRPPQPNLHSPNSRPAVQCNEGFCNAPEGQHLTLTTSTASQKPHHYAIRLAWLRLRTCLEMMISLQVGISRWIGLDRELTLSHIIPGYVLLYAVCRRTSFRLKVPCGAECAASR